MCWNEYRDCPYRHMVRKSKAHMEIGLVKDKKKSTGKG